MKSEKSKMMVNRQHMPNWVAWSQKEIQMLKSKKSPGSKRSKKNGGDKNG